MGKEEGEGGWGRSMRGRVGKEEYEGVGGEGGV